MSVCAKVDYELVDETTQNAYNLNVVKVVLIDIIRNTYNIKTLSMIAKTVMSYDNQIVRWQDDDGFGLAFNKHNDKMQEYLAEMKLREI